MYWWYTDVYWLPSGGLRVYGSVLFIAYWLYTDVYRQQVYWWYTDLFGLTDCLGVYWEFTEKYCPLVYWLHIQSCILCPVVWRWVKFNPGLGEALNIFPSSKNTSRLSKLLSKNTPRKLKYVNPKWQHQSIFKEVNQIAGWIFNSGLVGLTHLGEQPAALMFTDCQCTDGTLSLLTIAGWVKCVNRWWEVSLGLLANQNINKLFENDGKVGKMWKTQKKISFLLRKRWRHTKLIFPRFTLENLFKPIRARVVACAYLPSRVGRDQSDQVRSIQVAVALHRKVSNLSSAFIS